MTALSDRRIVAPAPVAGGPLALVKRIAEARAQKRAYVGGGCACYASGVFLDRDGKWQRCRRCLRGGG